jgi:hypothetical protein
MHIRGRISPSPALWQRAFAFPPRVANFSQNNRPPALPEKVAVI